MWDPSSCGHRKLRTGSYFPEWLLDALTRSERAFVQVVTEAYVRGISTRRVEGLVEALGVTSLSKSQVSELARDLDQTVSEFRNRPLDAGPYTYVWADGGITIAPNPTDAPATERWPSLIPPAPPTGTELRHAQLRRHQPQRSDCCRMDVLAVRV